MRIGDLCSYAPKSQIKAGEAIEGAKYMFFTSSADESKRYSNYQLDGEGIIMGTGGNATLHYYSGKYATSTDCVVLLPNEQVRCKYLYYFFKANMNTLEAGFKGAGLRHTNKKYIDNICINNIPNFDKQDEIIFALDKLQGLIDSKNAELALLDDLIKARFVELFGEPEYNTKKFPIAKLADLCCIGSSKRIYQSEQCSAGIPFLRISDLTARIDNGTESASLYIPEKKYEELSANGLVPATGDILITSRGTLGKCYIVKEEDKFYFQDGMISWLSKIDKRITNLYVAYLFSTAGIQKQISNLQAGSTVTYLSISMLKRLNVAIPPIELQTQFAAFVDQVNKSKAAIQKSLDEAQLLFDSLMQQYFG